MAFLLYIQCKTTIIKLKCQDTLHPEETRPTHVSLHVSGKHTQLVGNTQPRESSLLPKNQEPPAGYLPSFLHAPAQVRPMVCGAAGPRAMEPHPRDSDNRGRPVSSSIGGQAGQQEPSRRDADLCPSPSQCAATLPERASLTRLA